MLKQAGNSESKTTVTNIIGKKYSHRPSESDRDVTSQECDTNNRDELY